MLFSHLSADHTVFALDYGSDSVRAVQALPLLRPGVVTFVEGATQLTLPHHRFEHKVQLGLIDGPHAYPFPDLEYYYFYPHLDTGGLLIVDDIHIRSVHNLFDFLSADEMFRLEDVIENTAVFSRTGQPTFLPVGDGWPSQGYNGQDFDVAPARPGESERLERVSARRAYYLDELGPIRNTSRHFSLKVGPRAAARRRVGARRTKRASGLFGRTRARRIRVPHGNTGAQGGRRCGSRQRGVPPLWFQNRAASRSHRSRPARPDHPHHSAGRPLVLSDTGAFVYRPVTIA